MTDLLKKSSATEIVEAVRTEQYATQTDDVQKPPEKSADLLCSIIPTLSPEQQRRLWRKIDLRILPVLSALYLCCYLDRGTAIIWPRHSIRTLTNFRRNHRYELVLALGLSRMYRNPGEGNAKLEGMITQLNLTGNKYNVALVCYGCLEYGVVLIGSRPCSISYVITGEILELRPTTLPQPYCILEPPSKSVSINSR